MTINSAVNGKASPAQTSTVTVTVAGMEIAKANADMDAVLSTTTPPATGSKTINKPEVAAVAAGTSFDAAAAALYGINFPPALKGVTLTYSQPFITANGQLSIIISATKSPSLKVTTKTIAVAVIGIDNADKVEAVVEGNLNLPVPNAALLSTAVAKPAAAKTATGVSYSYSK